MVTMKSNGSNSSEKTETLAELRARWKQAGVSNYVSEKAGVIRLSEVRVKKAERSKGIGTQFMHELIAYADRTGQRIALSPSIDFGATSVDRLRHFYQRFGFVHNRGGKKDFTISESMIREPIGPSVTQGADLDESVKQTVPESTQADLRRQVSKRWF